CVYSSVVLEETDTPANEQLFMRLIRRLLGSRTRWTADAHPSVWVTVFEHEDRMVASFVNYQHDLPVVPVDDVAFSIRAPDGKRFTALTLAPDGAALPFELAGDGMLTATLPRLEEFAMVVASY